MSEPTDTPEWHLLPHNPAAFFGFSGEEIDRRELKRRYNQLIRRFKPERFPQEFQRIRAAFEQLDTEVRYGTQAAWSHAPTQEYQWVDDATETAHKSQPSSGERSDGSASAAQRVAIPLYQQLQRESAADVYRELNEKKAKTAFDFYSLAVMSDILDRKDGMQFVRWILQGLTAHKNDLGLLRLLHSYFRGPVPDASCDKLLIACSKIIHEDAFFPLTEPLWRMLLRGGDFAKFQSALKQCESNLKGMSIDGRIVFYLQILKPAMWIADEAWIEESMNFLENNFQRIPPFMDFDVEIVTRLREYIRHRARFANGQRIRQRLDQAMRDYFSEEQVVGDRSVVESQILVTQDVERLTEAFAKFDDPSYPAFYAIWTWVTYDVGERNVEAREPQANEDVWHTRTRTLLEQISQQTSNSRLGVFWAAATLLYRCVQVLCYVAPPIALGFLIAMLSMVVEGSRFDWLSAVGALVAVVSGLFLGHLLKNQLKIRVWVPICIAIATRCYRKIWQREVFNFMARSRIPYSWLVTFIEHNTMIPKAVWVKYFVDQDFALPIYASAQRFMI
jgi:hypothetical protein